MRALIAALILAPLLCGATCSTRPTAPEAPLAQCDAICYVPCVAKGNDTAVRWTGDPLDASSWDRVPDGVVDQLSEKLRVCETRRRACTECMDRLQHQGALRQ
ncbi:hypothetical protein [Arenimonas oryziterrae]|uniref:Lipoprotein n=1 Tax=Arenimonas oryziterrae DSM 21050 = YC6267 TaxID=1121015 RepID=A0A091AT46_9GAMM|nr:hypothetical protein [Arenimonas oryziterrae]KFN42337.1 hypothetical protein N789_14200 [Arenimonas oryziterrae DSM 21050 = YC6267]